MNFEQIIDAVRIGFNNPLSVQEKRKGIYQLFIPVFHEDGDAIDLFFTENNGKFILCDFGLTLQRLSYSYEIDTDNKNAILHKIITENGLTEEEGNIWLETTPASVFNDIMQISHAYAKIGSMRYFKREVIESLFFEMLDDYILSDLSAYNPQKKVYPIPSRDDLEVDYSFSPNGHPVYLFAVKDSSKARLATISCLEFQRANLNFRGWIVNEDFEKLSKKDRSRLTNACDKQFTSFEEFKSTANIFLQREKSV
ncbi:DUF1828 domain-containing protein [Chitinophaga deserti]|uniref:DUF1828 domain-containing protein n=1 Tax=Chitinophaga deserti TaxID=2164099 RepID=UPI000D6C783D|nr:DUF1828 domain-containing protein [Chitinophaga deserti]